MGESKQLCTVRSRDKFRKISKFEMYTTWYEHYQAVGCINGMLCMKRYISETQVIQIFLWNPSIRKALELPSPEMLTAEVRFDIDCAFGFDHVRNDYKVVASVYIGGGLHIPRFVEIFTLSTCSWKTVNIDRGPCLWIHGSPKVFLNGIIYWSGIDILKSTVKGRFSHFVSFDVVSEVFKYIDLPDLEHPNVWEHERFPINFEQSIGLMEIFETYTQIWVLEDVEGEKGGVSSYNIKNQEMKVLAKSYKHSPVFTTNYMESLALLKGVPDRNSYIFPPFEVILFEDVDDV
ncbi:F-box protein At1g52495-like [Beta vulgaris subsp. vulgaris]|uniref:F-box protein At1g52495-like n=1 Tax=Beta vulgaris subsp. vulgaris TaxID=3555 RepID=UPI0020374A9C|nr:F-box protein At1g52495-like [Beta vulgaris subsp. vulgaris]